MHTVCATLSAPIVISLIIYAYEIQNLIAVNKVCTYINYMVILILILFVDTTLLANRKKISETRIIYYYSSTVYVVNPHERKRITCVSSSTAMHSSCIF